MNKDMFTSELGAFVALHLEGKVSPTQDEPAVGPPSFPGNSHWLWDTACPARCSSSGLAPCHLERAGVRSRGHSLRNYSRGGKAEAP